MSAKDFNKERIPEYLEEIRHNINLASEKLKNPRDSEHIEDNPKDYVRKAYGIFSADEIIAKSLYSEDLELFSKLYGFVEALLGTEEAENLEILAIEEEVRDENNFVPDESLVQKILEEEEIYKRLAQDYLYDENSYNI